MSIHVALSHVTSYRYDRPVNLGPHVVRLRPAPHCRSRILAYSLRVEPEGHFLNWQQDPESNFVARLVFPERVRELRVTVDVVAEMAVVNPFDYFLEPGCERFPFEYEPALKHELAPYLETLPSSPLVDAFVASVPRDEVHTNDFLVSLNQRIAREIRYLIRLEPGLQSPEQTLEKQSGSCRDSSWLLVQVLRRLGLAARFASGYLVQLKADVKPLDDGPAGPPQDFLDLHAWCEVYLPGAGWVGLDPTSGLFAGEGHLPLACTPDPTSAAPISGLVDECECEFEHAMTVTRVWEAPRVTKPYTEAQWARIEEMGRTVDAALEGADVRLTMGGEPTFVSIDDPDGDEWNTAALGPNKRRLAAELFHRLRDRYAPRGLAHFGQGKWYPGEPLPRWSLNCYWRRDGEPLWSSRALIADESRPAGTTEAQARQLLAGVATRLQVDPAYVFPAYEDLYYYLWREHRLPVNVDPLDSKLDDAGERERLFRVFSAGLGSVVGHALPITRDASGRFRSGSWHLRGGRCHLVPGDSPMGLRLPLDAQPFVAARDRHPWSQADPGVARPPLPSRAELRRQQLSRDTGAARAGAPDDRMPRAGESAPWVVRTAMCAEPRGGVLYVFMPPCETLDDYVELLAAVEGSAEELALPVIIEGYEPPRDPRITRLSVTPDPGVIEVNVQPAGSWDELVDHTTHLYEAARLSRLATEKFMLDGRHTGTGGGNHVVLGGATPADSPFLRRPDLLRSLLAVWQQHPSLSYLFSGAFIGPTSQAPRVDEARLDSLFELEIAFADLDRQLGLDGGAAPPWRVDRLFRDLLADVTGNTHRTEICIDKLFSPDGPAGRLGLVELRAFEMPPHARMSLTQQLLLRALVARLWRAPHAPRRLARWGTGLHDRFLLPHYVWLDFEDVLADLAEHGFALDPAWFAPHFEFRFPKLGDFTARGLDVELRAALEPWHVMAEDATANGTARYVDSSLERLQVKVTGLVPDRYVVTCNGRALPLRPTDTVGEAVAGVRYRAWQPPRCLHPHIGVDSPLTFDVVDRWMERSLGGAQVHVAHPGGRSFETRPINAFEAEGRRLSRYFRIGHTPGKMSPPDAAPSADFPFTLDLRRR